MSAAYEYLKWILSMPPNRLTLTEQFAKKKLKDGDRLIKLMNNKHGSIELYCDPKLEIKREAQSN